MAQSALQIIGTAVGYAFGGPIGGAVGGALGGALGGAIAGNPKMEGPRLNDLSVSGSTYGVQIPLIYGDENRVAGNIIWSSGLIESSRTTTQGGKGGGGTDIREYSYSVSMAIALGQGAHDPGDEGNGGLLRIWANKKLLFDMASVSVPPDKYEEWSLSMSSNDSAGLLQSIAFYPGTFEQSPDPTIQSFLGVDDTPAFVGTSYVVLTGLQLADYGNSIPNIEFEWQGLEANSVGRVVNDIVLRTEMPVDEYAISHSLYSKPLRGYVISKAGSSAAALQPLLTARFMDAIDFAGTVYFQSKGRAPIASIDDTDMAAREQNSDIVDRIILERLPEIAMPKEAVVNYSDLDRDYQISSQRSERLGTTAQEKISQEVPLTLSASEARQIADYIIWGAWTARVSARFSLPFKYCFLKPADVVVIFSREKLLTVRINRIEEGYNGILIINAVVDDLAIYNGSTDGAITFVPANVVGIVGDTFIYLYDGPFLRPDSTDTGFYFAIDADQNGWRGGALLRSIDNATYSEVFSTGIRNVTGEVAIALGSASPDLFDYINEIFIELHYEDAELESVGEIGVLNGRNACWIGSEDGSQGEVLQYAFVQLISDSPKIYRLSGLLRGRRASEHYIGAHANNEIFVFIGQNSIREADFSITDWNRLRWYKGVSVLQSEDDVTDVTEFTNTGERAKPRAPVLDEAVRDGSNDLAVTWFRRTRLYSPGLGYGPVPLGESTEAYEVDIIVSSVVVRTILTATPEVEYSASEQTADGITPGNLVEMNVYQMSETRGRGWPGEFIV